VFLPTLARMGVRAQLELVRWGFYPAGGGEIRVHIAGRAAPLRPLVLDERQELQRVWGTAAVTNLPAHIPQRMAARACNVLAGAGISARVEPRRLRGTGPGAGIFLFAEYTTPAGGETVAAGFTAYGRKGLPAERVAEAACQDLLGHHRSGAPADPHLADQLVLPMALAEGESRVRTSRVSQHLLTSIWVVRAFLARDIRAEGKLGASGTLVIEGRGGGP